MEATGQSYSELYRWHFQDYRRPVSQIIAVPSSSHGTNELAHKGKIIFNRRCRTLEQQTDVHTTQNKHN